MATFPTSQCQDAGKVLNVRNETVKALKGALENQNTRKSASRRILSGILLGIIYASKVVAKEKLEKLKSDLNWTRTHTYQTNEGL